MNHFRHQSRECALQILFSLNMMMNRQQKTLTHPDSVGAHIESFWRNFTYSEEAKQFAELLVKQTVDNLSEIDQVLAASSQHWRLERMEKIDLNILRLAACELIFLRDTPYQVIIDEALELAKTFSHKESTSFINGVLAALVKEKSDVK